jgi:hypothetical protein
MAINSTSPVSDRTPYEMGIAHRERMKRKNFAEIAQENSCIFTGMGSKIPPSLIHWRINLSTKI